MRCLFIHTPFIAEVGTLYLFCHNDLRASCWSGCRSRYYHNYRIDQVTLTRVYYGGIPDVIQVAQHYYIESALLEMFTNQMVFSW